MPKTIPVFIAALAATALAACGSSSTAGQSPSPVGSASPTATATPSAVATTLDPCLLVTSSEAAKMSGTTFGQGTEGTTSGGSKTCVYGGQTLHIVMVLVAQAPDAATAQTTWTQEEAEAQTLLGKAAGSGVSITLNINDITDLPGADRAATAFAVETVAGRSINITAIYVLKGTIFFTFSSVAVNQPSATTAALEAQARTVLTRIH